eukprot:360769-Chlamydomonas_euryale.AAC.2
MEIWKLHSSVMREVELSARVTARAVGVVNNHVSAQTQNSQCVAWVSAAKRALCPATVPTKRRKGAIPRVGFCATLINGLGWSYMISTANGRARRGMPVARTNLVEQGISGWKSFDFLPALQQRIQPCMVLRSIRGQHHICSG